MRARAVLILSLALNFALVVAVAQRLAARQATSPPKLSEQAFAPQPPKSKPVVSPAETAKPVSSVTSNSPAPTAGTAQAAFHWNGIDTPDLKQLIANLRAIGCPEQTIRDLVTAAVLRLYAPRLAALRGTDRPFQFWDSMENIWTPERIERERKINALMKERNDLLKELLGLDLMEERRKVLGLPDPQAGMLTYLPKEKADQVQDILRRFGERRQAVTLRSRGFRDAEDEEEMKQLAKEQRAAIAAVLTPQELFEHELREFGRHDDALASFAPTEAEFRATFKLEHDFDLRRADFDQKSATPEQRKAYQEAAKQKDADLKAALGEARYAEYERTKNWDYRQLERVTDRYDLGKETAVKVWEMRQAAEAAANKLNENAALSDDAREAARRAMRLEVEKTLQGTLGERAWKSFLRNASDWLDNVAQLPEPQKP